LPAEGVVFCSFNNSYKISPAFFAVWMRIVKGVKDSVLWVLEPNDLVKRNLRREAEKHGVDADRMVFAPPLPQAEHLARQRHADLFLDTLPCNAHTTASDALCVGLPVLTCTGTTLAGRVAASILTAAGLPELIASSPEEYERVALRLAGDPPRLAALRRNLTEGRDSNPLFDRPRTTRHIETAYARMWGAWLSGASPTAFVIDGT
jgi:protein O-GlcNAc transferase